MSACPSCGTPGPWSGSCPMCAGDWDAAFAHGLIEPDYPEPQPTPEEECMALSGHDPMFPAAPLVMSCWCGSVTASFSPALTLPG